MHPRRSAIAVDLDACLVDMGYGERTNVAPPTNAHHQLQVPLVDSDHFFANGLKGTACCGHASNKKRGEPERVQ